MRVRKLMKSSGSPRTRPIAAPITALEQFLAPPTICLEAHTQPSLLLDRIGKAVEELAQVGALRVRTKTR